MGLIYNNSEQLEKVVKDLVHGIFKDEENKNNYLAKEITVKFKIMDPDFNFFLDPGEPEIMSTKDALKADITIIMEADFMHDFWLRKTNIIESIKKGDFKIDIAPEVAAAKLIDLLPVLACGLDVYPIVCDKHDIVV